MRVTFFGWTVGFILAILFILVVDSLGVRGTQSPLALGMGVGVGFMQARQLSPNLASRAPWLRATVFGLAVPFILVDLARAFDLPVPYSLAVLVALGGISVSVLQWRILQKVSDRTVLWLAASPPGWILGGSTVWISDQWLPRIPGLVGALLYVAIILAGGILLGACTAPALTRIAQPRLN